VRFFKGGADASPRHAQHSWAPQATCIILILIPGLVHCHRIKTPNRSDAHLSVCGSISHPSQPCHISNVHVHPQRILRAYLCQWARHPKREIVASHLACFQYVRLVHRASCIQTYVDIEVFHINLREKNLKVLLDYFRIEAILGDGVFDGQSCHGSRRVGRRLVIDCVPKVSRCVSTEARFQRNVTSLYRRGI
jgi:hypothetical protein